MVTTPQLLADCLRHGFRLHPTFVILGAAKSGTTSLFGALKRHPDVCLPRVKEINYFSAYFEKGPGWYRRQFPLRWKAVNASAVTGDASPAYLGVPECAARIHAHFGADIRLVAILRDPVERAWSHYWHRRRLGAEPLSFVEAIARETARLEAIAAGEQVARRGGIAGWDWYLGGGNYAALLGRYLKHFPPSALHVMFNEELGADPASELDGLAAFLGLRPGLMELPRLNAGVYPPMPAEQRRQLAAHFAAPNAALAELLGRAPPW
jgi:hypothetical protein